MMISFKLPIHNMVDPMEADRSQLRYNGRLSPEIALFQGKGTGNAGTPTEKIRRQLSQLGSGYIPELIFHPMCGAGRWAQETHTCWPTSKYVGVDISRHTIDAAIALGPDENSSFWEQDVSEPWPESAYNADLVLLTFEAINYFNSDALERLLRRLGELPRLQRLLIDAHVPLTSDFRSRASLGLTNAHPFTMSGSLVFERRRYIGRRPSPEGFQDAILTLSKHGVRFARSSVWYHDPAWINTQLSKFSLLLLDSWQDARSSTYIYRRAS